LCCVFCLFVFIFSLMCGGVQHILCCHFLFCLTSSFVLCVLVYQRRRQTKQKTQHNMCWTSPHTREKIKTNKTKNHNTLCVGHYHTQEKR
jgi:UDP-2,3-diacylglucosamine pyrophosphatase LpxH